MKSSVGKSVSRIQRGPAGSRRRKAPGPGAAATQREPAPVRRKRTVSGPGSGRRLSKLEKSEARFRGLTALSSDWYWEQDRHFRFLGRSREAENRSGLSSGGYAGRTRWELPHVGVSAEQWAEHKARLEAHLPFRNFEMGRPAEDGSIVWVSISGEPVFDRGGRFRGYRGVGQNITDRKLAERLLSDSEARLRSLLALSSDWYWEQDEHFRFIEESEKAVEHVKRPADDRLGKTRWEVPSVGVTEAQWVEHKALLQAHQPFRDFEVGRDMPDGSTLWLSVSGEPKYDEHGKFTGYRGVTRNITHRKEVERRLRESEDWFRSLTGLTSDWYWEQDEQFRFLGPRPNLRFASGIYDDKRVGKTRWELETVGVSDAAWAQHRATLEAHLPFRDFEMGRTLEDGSTAWISVSGEPVFDEHGRFTGYRGVGRDITSRKRAEAQVQSLNEELRRQVAELEAANREMESFSYSVSHDLRAPLRAMDGFSRLLIEEYAGRLGEQGCEFLERISANAVRMGELIDALLNLSRTMRARMQREDLDLSRMAAEVIAALREAGGDRQVEVSIAPNLHAHGDRHLVYIMLENLLANAWKFTSRRDRAQIEFRAAGERGSGVFVVRDNGAGFDMAYVDKMFGAFQRLHGAAEFTGTGIGLATVQRIVQRHGGRVWAEGEVGRGAAFYFALA